MFHNVTLDDRRRLVLWALLLWPFVAALITLTFIQTMLGTVIVFLVVPSLILSYAAHDHVEIEKVFTFSLVMAIPGTIITDYLAEASGAWFITTVFPYKLFGLITVEGFLWSLFTVYYVIMFYDYFIHHHETHRIIYPQMRYFTLLLAGILILATALFMQLPSTLSLPYFYLWFGATVILLPVAVEMYAFPDQIAGMLKTGAYFFVVFFIYETTALEIGAWSFPATHTRFIGWVSFLGHRFPLEELIFYILLFSMSLIAYYRVWDDND